MSLSESANIQILTNIKYTPPYNKGTEYPWYHPICRNIMRPLAPRNAGHRAALVERWLKSRHSTAARGRSHQYAPSLCRASQYLMLHHSHNYIYVLLYQADFSLSSRILVLCIYILLQTGIQKESGVKVLTILNQCDKMHSCVSHC